MDLLRKPQEQQQPEQQSHVNQESQNREEKKPLSWSELEQHCSNIASYWDDEGEEKKCHLTAAETHKIIISSAWRGGGNGGFKARAKQFQSH